jgi:hypothetical protein
LTLAILLAMSLVLWRGLSPLVMVIIILSAVLTFFGLALATKIVTGEENLVYYHHEIAVLSVVTVVLWLLGQPVLAYLDATLLGIGAFLVCGRIGCLMVGCCHGRPHRWGVCYRAEHAEAGFPIYYVGIRLFPIQAIESLWVLFIVCTGSLLILSGQPAGAALAWYVVLYDLGRFCFEFVRGDADRPYRWGFSEAQWISLILIGIVAAAELIGILPLHLWHVAALAGLVLAMIAVTLLRRRRGIARHQFLHPRHVKEVAEALELPHDPAASTIPIVCTSQGVQISRGQLWRGATCFDHYTLSLRDSARDGALREDDARVLADLILQLKHAPASSELVAGRQGAFHLLIRSHERTADQREIIPPPTLRWSLSLQEKRPESEVA